jgi:hypothetical protein
LATAAALAEWPERLQKVFTNTEYSSNGIFEVNLFLRGEQVKVSVDDRLPTEDNSLYNSKKSPNGAYWLPILEKAMAKFYVNYSNLNGGDMEESLIALTGMPTTTVYSNKETADSMFKIIKNADNK